MRLNRSFTTTSRTRRLLRPGAVDDKIARWCWLLPLALLAACSDEPLPPVAQSGELVVVTYRSPTTYYQKTGAEAVGLEHDLVKLFADQLGVKFRFEIVANSSKMLPALTKHQAHIAAGIPVNSGWKGVRYGPPYQTVQLQLVYRNDSARPAGWQGLGTKKVVVPAGSNAVDQLKEASRHVHGLQWEETENLNIDDLLEKVAQGEIDYTIASSHALDVARNFHPQLAVAFNIGFPLQLAWAFPKNGDPELPTRAQAFFAKIAQDGTLKRLYDRYYGHIKRLDQLDVIAFLQKKDTVLPHYRSLFQEAQRLTAIDWRFLAALAYQESHWNPLATSPTNVRGMMMLTEDTADQLKVSNRLDPKESILAGAHYFLSLKDNLPARIPEPDRTWMALAVYNTGYGHVEDARVLAQRQGLNPDSWLDLKKTLPLLAKEEYAAVAKHGYARGGEAVVLTENVRTYYDILVKFESPLAFSLRNRWIERGWLGGLFN